jgi:murein DD-endopeptidase MepM/ murein hydrolase activator NlpD
MRRRWIFVAAVLAAGALAVGLWKRPELGRLVDGRTPRERYVDALRSAGLGDTALVRDWVAAADHALGSPRAAALPLETDGRHSPAAPEAYGYRFRLQRGRLLRVELTVTGTEPAIVFIELFAADESTSPVAVSDRDETRLEHEIEKDGEYILRIQPELLRGGEMQIAQRTTASLTFPVSGRTAASVKSFFLDPRDNNRRQHHGIDIFAPRETPVVAAADGFVTFVGTSELGGNVVWVWDAARGQSHYYAHMARQAVTAGSRIEAGDVLGYVGNTGNAKNTPPHLHFGIYSRGEGPVDPLPFVKD